MFIGVQRQTAIVRSRLPPPVGGSLPFVTYSPRRCRNGSQLTLRYLELRHPYANRPSANSHQKLQLQSLMPRNPHLSAGDPGVAATARPERTANALPLFPQFRCLRLHPRPRTLRQPASVVGTPDTTRSMNQRTASSTARSCHRWLSESARTRESSCSGGTRRAVASPARIMINCDLYAI